MAASAFVLTAKRNRAGNYDLRIDEASRAVTLPQLGGRRAPLTLARHEIVGVSLQRRITKNPSGYYFSYLPAIDCAGRDGGFPTIKLVRWGWSEAKARAFAQWLSEQLAVEFKGIQGEHSA
jgi:hypothetical protein